MDENNYKSIKLDIGECRGKFHDIQEVEFTGRLIANAHIETGTPPYTNNSGEIYEVYETIKGNLVYWKQSYDCWDGGVEKSEMETFASIDELEGKAPSWLIRDAQKALGMDVVEHLDI